MKKRNIPFGYEIKNGEIAVCPIAAQVVRDVYIKYLGGKSFLNIADELTEKQIDYYDGKTVWSKPMVKRLLECRFYLGCDKYPQIIDEKTFNAVAKLIATKYSGYNNDPRATSLKKRSFCQECGERLYHDNQSKRYTSWKCKRCTLRISEKRFYSGVTEILNSVISHPELLDEIEETKTYESEYAITDKVKTIDKLIKSPTADFDTVFGQILDLASAKYDNCEYDISEELTETIKADYISRKEIDDVDTELIDKTVSHITVDMNSKIAIHFINGAIVRTKGEENNEDS